VTIKDNRKQGKRWARKAKLATRKAMKAQLQFNRAGQALKAMGVMEVITYLDALVDFVRACDEVEAA
jgi:hypothetical protein